MGEDNVHLVCSKYTSWAIDLGHDLLSKRHSVYDSNFIVFFPSVYTDAPFISRVVEFREKVWMSNSAMGWQSFSLLTDPKVAAVQL